MHQSSGLMFHGVRAAQPPLVASSLHRPLNLMLTFGSEISLHQLPFRFLFIILYEMVFLIWNLHIHFPTNAQPYFQVLMSIIKRWPFTRLISIKFIHFIINHISRFRHHIVFHWWTMKVLDNGDHEHSLELKSESSWSIHWSCVFFPKHKLVQTFDSILKSHFCGVWSG